MLIFVTGPSGMCDSIEKELSTLHIYQKFIRVEHTAAVVDITENKTFTLTVVYQGEQQTLTMNNTETVLTALERCGILTKNRCRVGHCGFCRSRILSGTYRATRHEKLRIADKQFGYFHPCCSYPTSDMTIEIY